MNKPATPKTVEWNYMHQLLFTTSWDDGHILDTRIAELLNRYGLKGTFYVLPSEERENAIQERDIKELSEQHEIGAHTLKHENVSTYDKEHLAKEIVDSKTWIESITDKPCNMFCYPRGDTTPEAKQLVQEAGFIGARTTKMMEFGPVNDPYLLPTTLQTYPFPWRPKYKQWWHHLDPLGPMRVKLRRMCQLKMPLRAYTSWQSLAQSLLLSAIRTKQPFFHIWGHAKEIDRYNMWNDLQEFFAFARKQNIMPVTNSELITSVDTSAL